MCASKDINYFASAAELRRFQHLRLLQNLGDICELELQPKYPIFIGPDKICDYRADFAYRQGGRLVVEDVKPTKNEKYLAEVFKLKRKMVAAIYGIDIQIIKA